MDSCIFCKIINKEIPSKIVYENEHVLAFNDISPASPVHVLIIPKIHVDNVLSIEELGQDVVDSIFKAISIISKELNVSDDGFRIVCNTKEHGGQTVSHLHFHLLGGRHMAWPPG